LTKKANQDSLVQTRSGKVNSVAFVFSFSTLFSESSRLTRIFLFYCIGFQSNRSVRGRGKGKSSGATNTSDRPGSRFNSKYFGEKIIRILDERKRKIIQDRGFDILLKYDGCSTTKGFVQWIAD
jgi:hypothetical protein